MNDEQNNNNDDAVVVFNNANDDDVNNNQLIPSDDDDRITSSRSSTTTTASVSTMKDAHLLVTVQAKMAALEEATQRYRQAEQDMKRLTSELRDLRNFKPPQQQQQQQQQESGADLTEVEFGGYIYRRYLGPEIHHLENLIQYILPMNRGQWHKAFSWVQNCIALRCNDELQSQIQAYDPPGRSSHPILNVQKYATILNGCLQHNTHVTDLTVNMNVLLLGERWMQHETNEQVIASMTSIIQPVLKYIATSPVLRRVSVVSDGSVRCRDLSAPFLDAIRRNQSIAELEVAGRIPPGAFATLLSSTSSITTLSMDCYTMSNDASPDEMVEKVQLCRAFAFQNNTNNNNNAPVLQTIRIQKFDIEWVYLLDCIVEGDCATRLQQLTLHARNDDDDVRQDLRSLMHLIQRCSALQHLTLEEFALNVDDVHCILHGIGLRQQQQVTANPTSSDSFTAMTKLSLIQCTFMDDAAARMLIGFFQSPLSSSSDNDIHNNCRGTAERPPPTTALLPELEIEFNHLFAEETEYFPLSGLSLGQAMAALITPPPTTTMTSNDERARSTIGSGGGVATTTHHNHHHRDTIGSQLQVLSLHPFAAMTGFCETILIHGKTVQLPALHLSYLMKEDIDDLSTCLPYLSSLRELRLNKVEKDIQPNVLLELIQHSGNLRTVTVLDMDEKQLFDDRQLLLAESYCERNRILSQIRTRKLRLDHSDNDSDQYCSQPTTKRQKTCDDIHENVALMPRLLQTAKQVPYTRVSVILSALMCFEYNFDFVGSY